MKTLFLIVLMCLPVTILKSEEIFFPSKVGTVLIYKTFDKKDKESSMLKYTIKSLSVKGNDMDITYQCESYDAKQKLLYKEDITIHKKGDILYLDMSNLINKAVFQQNGEVSPEITISGNNMEIPSNPKAGDILPDANVVMAMNMGIVKMKLSADVTSRKVEGIEDVTVKGGTFKCYKFSNEVTSSAMGIKMKTKNVEWYAKGIGMVKNESYDKNGKLQSHMELVEVQK